MVRVLTRITCPACKGKAFLPTDEEIIIVGWKYKRRLPCSACNGRGEQIKWLTISDLARLLKEIDEDKPAHGGIL
jgi:predicted methyltransferase